MSKEILVVPRNKLFSTISQFQGFLNFEKNKNFINNILENFEYAERNDSLEKDSNYKQIIPYVWLLNKQEKKVFLYKRAKTGNETRLHDKYSGGVGGHIDKDTEENSNNPIMDAMIRELKEEVIMKEYPSPTILGYINDETGEVEKVHFGVVAIGETKENITPAEDMVSGRFYTLEEIDTLFADPKTNIENWTKTTWPFVKEYLLSN